MSVSHVQMFAWRHQSYTTEFILYSISLNIIAMSTTCVFALNTYIPNNVYPLEIYMRFNSWERFGIWPNCFPFKLCTQVYINITLDRQCTYKTYCKQSFRKYQAIILNYFDIKITNIIWEMCLYLKYIIPIIWQKTFPITFGVCNL